MNCNYGQVICMLYKKLKLYSRYKESRSEELYLSLPIPRRLRVDLARYRTTSHSLEIQLGRHYNIARSDRLCKLCTRLSQTRGVHKLKLCSNRKSDTSPNGLLPYLIIIAYIIMLHSM